MARFDLSDPIDRARLSLEGLSVGDAFGERFFGPSPAQSVAERELPPAPWRYTDDTVMAGGIVEVLEACGEVDADRLAEVFARNYADDPNRGYGAGAHQILQKIGQGVPWQEAAGGAFGGEGSFGNGGGMRAAPVGGYFAQDFGALVDNAKASARVTHAHPEGQAGAIAVAVAAAVAFQTRDDEPAAASERIFEEVLARTPVGRVRDGIERAHKLGLDASVDEAVNSLGNGSRVTAMDTIPYVIWSACARLDDYEDAMWQTVSGGGDRDTTCAMVGGIVALRHGYEAIPDAWLEARALS